ncbi:hypothetical protein Tco_1227414 [Tanacetum coccineum]
MSVRELLLQEKLHKALQAVYEKLNQQEQAANVSTHTPKHSRRFNFIYYDYEEITIPLNEIISQIPSSITITPILSTIKPEDSLIMRDENLSTIPEKELDEFIKSSVEDLVPIPSPRIRPTMIEENFKIYSNPLFEFDDEYISSDVNPLFHEVLEDIESKDSYVSNFDEPALLVTPLSIVVTVIRFGGEIELAVGEFAYKDTIPESPTLRCFRAITQKAVNNEPDNR